MTSRNRLRDDITDEEIIRRFGESAKKMPWPKRIGRLKRPGYVKPMEIYLIWCHRCRQSPNRGFTVSNARGYEKRLQCSYCHERYDHLLPERKIGDMLLNPHRYPSLIALLLIAAVVFSLIVSRC